MDAYRIKLKIGEHEFEAEGPADMVQSQFQAFKELIATIPSQPNVTTQQRENQGETAKNPPSGDDNLPFDKIYRVDGRIVSLTVRPESDRVAALLVMLGHKVYRNNETVTAGEIRDGLEHSGYRFSRVDRLMDPLMDEGSVIQIGTKKSTRYRLTNPGVAKAQAAAKEEIARVA